MVEWRQVVLQMSVPRSVSDGSNSASETTNLFMASNEWIKLVPYRTVDVSDVQRIQHQSDT